MTKADALEVRIYLFRMGLLLALTVCAALAVFWMTPRIQPAQIIMIAIFVGGFTALILTKHWTMDYTVIKTQQVLDLAEAGIGKIDKLRCDLETIAMGRAKQLDEIQLTSKATYTLCNTQYGAALQSLASVTMRLAEVSKSEADRIAAEQALAAARDHEAKQALVAVTVPMAASVAEVAAAVVAAAASAPPTDPSGPGPSNPIPADSHESKAGMGQVDGGAVDDKSGIG